MPLIARLAGPMPLRMSRFACKLLALLAVLLMPFGMSAVPAAAVHHAHAGAMPMEHCPEQSPGDTGKPGATECMMACSAALPAADLRLVDTGVPAKMPVRPVAVHTLSGIELEIATPPPKFV